MPTEKVAYGDCEWCGDPAVETVHGLCHQCRQAFHLESKEGENTSIEKHTKDFNYTYHNMCPKCGKTKLQCLAGKSAHPNNWYCPDETCGWKAWE